MNKDVVEITEELEQLHPQPMLVGEYVEEFEESLEEVLNEQEWKNWILTTGEKFYE